MDLVLANDRELRYQAELASLLERLRDLDLSNDIYDESRHPRAHGGSSDVFTANSRKHGDGLVAVKRLRTHLLYDRGATRIMFNEFRIWSSMKHPNVHPLLGYIMHGAYPAFISRWMANGSLLTYLQNTPGISLVYMAKGIANGLLYLHIEKVIHADLKSGNILVSDEGDPLLTDFGISRMMDSSSSTRSGGSARWMAIELVNPSFSDSAVGAGRHTPQTDVWAYGMVLYELLTRRLPFYEFKRDEMVLLSIARGRKPFPPSISQQANPQDPHEVLERRLLWGISEKCWNEDPLARPRMETIYTLLKLATPLPHEVYDEEQSDGRVEVLGTPSQVIGPEVQLVQVGIDDIDSEGVQGAPLSAYASCEGNYSLNLNLNEDAM